MAKSGTTFLIVCLQQSNKLAILNGHNTINFTGLISIIFFPKISALINTDLFQPLYKYIKSQASAALFPNLYQSRSGKSKSRQL